MSSPCSVFGYYNSNNNYHDINFNSFYKTHIYSTTIWLSSDIMIMSEHIKVLKFLLHVNSVYQLDIQTIVSITALLDMPPICSQRSYGWYFSIEFHSSGCRNPPCKLTLNLMWNVWNLVYLQNKCNGFSSQASLLTTLCLYVT